MAQPLVPPDLIGAGVASQPQPVTPPRQTTLPSQAAQQMRPEMRPDTGMDTGMSGLGLMSLLAAPQPAPNLGLAAAAGMSAGLSGRLGNPYLAQHQQQMGAQQQRQAQMVQLADRMQQRRLAQEEKRDEAKMVILEGLRDSDNPRAQEVYGLEMSARAKRLGLNIPPRSFVQSAQLGKDELALIHGDIVAGLPDADIIARHPKLARMPGFLAPERQKLRNPAIRAKLGYKTDEELRAERVERERKMAESETAIWRAKHKDIEDKSLPYVAQYVQSQAGIPLIGLDPSNPAHQELKSKALAWARGQVKANDTAWLSFQETRRHNRATESRLEREQRLKAEQTGGFGTPLPASSTSAITSAVRLSDATAAIDRIANDPESRKIVNDYIGPYASRYAQAQRWAPGGALGQTPPEVVDLHQRVASLKNYVIKLITGAQMSEVEARRITEELPDVKLPPDQFWRRYENTKKDIARMRQIVDAAIIRGDRRALAVMRELEGAPPTHAPSPLNPSLNPSPAPAQGWGRAQRVN